MWNIMTNTKVNFSVIITITYINSVGGTHGIEMKLDNVIDFISKRPRKLDL